MELREEILIRIRDFELPSYNEIPDVGLFLEQTTKYISGYLAPLTGVSLTGSMISNYVKKKIIRNPVKKQYNREQIAFLFFIAIAKTVLALEDIQLLLRLQAKTCETKEAYEYFRWELNNLLAHIYGLKEEADPVTGKHQVEKSLMRNTLAAVVNKVYLDDYFSVFREELESKEKE